MNQTIVRFFCICAVVATMTTSFTACKDDECAPASEAMAGDDQEVVGTSTTLEGNVPATGKGAWRIVSGEGGIIADEKDPGSAFTGVIGTTYILRWTISGCPSSEDDVSVSFICDPDLAANAGQDQTVVGTSTTLTANGSGAWTIISGTGGNIAQPSSATSNFTGVLGNSYVLRWSVACPQSTDDVQINFVSSDPQLLTVDKTSVINGEIITVTGANFSANYNGGSQINAVKTADPLSGQEIFLFILSRTNTQIKAVMSGVNGGLSGIYNLRYSKKPDANPATLFPSNLSVSIINPGATQFNTSSTFTSTSIQKGTEASFGVKNGSTNAADYSVKLVHYDYTSGNVAESDATNLAITAGGFGGSMDKLSFTVPANLQTSGIHYVKVTYGGATLIGGWGSLLNIF